MVNFDDVTKNHKIIKSKLVTNSRSSVLSINNWRLGIWKNRFII